MQNVWKVEVGNCRVVIALGFTGMIAEGKYDSAYTVEHMILAADNDSVRCLIVYSGAPQAIMIKQFYRK